MFGEEQSVRGTGLPMAMAQLSRGAIPPADLAPLPYPPHWRRSALPWWLPSQRPQPIADHCPRLLHRLAIPIRRRQLAGQARQAFQGISSWYNDGKINRGKLLSINPVPVEISVQPLGNRAVLAPCCRANLLAQCHGEILDGPGRRLGT